MKKVLIVDDSHAMLALLKNELYNADDIDTYFASSYKEAKELVDEHQGNFHASILDFNLHDAKRGEIIALANSYNIPILVISSTKNTTVQKEIRKKDILELIIKDGLPSLKYMARALERVLKNHDTTILIVDDSKLYRERIANLLKKLKLHTIEAANGEEALKIINKQKSIKLVITDNEMPNMDGLELIYKLREKYKKDRLAIIAMSSAEDQETISNFLKYGANDFVHKPFSQYEIIARINANLELVDLFDKINDMANKDFLTGAYNRRFFYEIGETIYKKASRKKSNLAVAMIDIDKFKSINDTYGHDIGDIAIKEVKKILDTNLRSSDLMARFGGEEFCVLLEDISIKNVQALFEKIRQNFQNNIITIGDVKISYTVSIGIYYRLAYSLDETIRLSDESLYMAKERGRNKIVIKQ